jgi:predicted  nucleic acid-binding Zn-ribbon protein
MALAPLLDLQDMDLTSDALVVRRRTLPERSERVENQSRAAALDVGWEALSGQRDELHAAEQALAAEVAAASDKAREVEDTLYSGTVKSPKELEGLQTEARLMRDKQAGLEERELELMEQMEEVEGQIQTNRNDHDECESRDRSLDAAIVLAEGEIDAELVALGESRSSTVQAIPSPVLEKYVTLRAVARLKGRAAARLVDGTCQACRIRLPVLECQKIKNQPAEALVYCTQCKRVLVR